MCRYVAFASRVGMQNARDHTNCVTKHRKRNNERSSAVAIHFVYLFRVWFNVKVSMLCFCLLHLTVCERAPCSIYFNYCRADAVRSPYSVLCSVSGDPQVSRYWSCCFFRAVFSRWCTRIKDGIVLFLFLFRCCHRDQSFHQLQLPIKLLKFYFIFTLWQIPLGSESLILC